MKSLYLLVLLSSTSIAPNCSAQKSQSPPGFSSHPGKPAPTLANPITAPSHTLFASTRFGKVQFKRTTFRGHEAWHLSDGHTFATVVPALARVMEYGFVGEQNILWHNPDDLSSEETKNHGGDKTWLAPQTQWPLIGGSRWSAWPPDPAWEQVAHTAQLLPGPVLRVVGPVSRASGVALSREYSFAANGDFVISQIATKKSGPPMYLSLWSITQVPKPDAIYLPLNPKSPYKQGFHWQSAPLPEAVADVSPTHLQLRPLEASGYKVGADSPIATIVSVRGGTAFRLRAPKPPGQYPDGADKAGFPIEIYSSGLQKNGQLFCELELLGPVKLTRPGQSWRHTLRWDLRHLTHHNADSNSLNDEVKALLSEAIPTDQTLN